MSHTAAAILGVLDRACANCTFPMLDNGYVYLAASRMTLFRSPEDWALAIEIFGYSPRTGLPDIHIHTFASRLHNRDQPENYVNEKAYQNYLASHPDNESRFIFPIEEGPWMDDEDSEVLAESGNVTLRDQAIPLPPRGAYAEHGIILEAERPQVFELCRYLAAIWRDHVLASASERRVSVVPEMESLLQLDEWHHPDVAANELPSDSETFQQVADVLATGDPSKYRPSRSPNNHWSHWPEGGLL